MRWFRHSALRRLSLGLGVASAASLFIGSLLPARVQAAAPVLTVAGSTGGITAYYVDWTAANPGAGTAAGVISLPDGSTVNVTFQAVLPSGAPSGFLGAQTNGGTNYWIPSAPYISTEVPNPPPTPDLLQLSGGDNTIYKVHLSQPIRDPIMAIVSLGSGSNTITYNFDSPFTIVSQGRGFWGGGPTSLVALANNVLQGTEGHGTIKFLGTFSDFSWTVPRNEFWHGFTFAIRTTEVLAQTIEVNEGQTALNTGTWSDPDGDGVTLSASVGSVVQNANGTWNWSYTPTDGPAQSQTVTITATDSTGAATSQTFPLKVNNLPPAGTLTAGPAFAGSPATISFTNPTDPSSVDAASLHFAFACDNGSLAGATYTGSSASPTTTCTFPNAGPVTVRGRVIDKDGAFAETTATVNVAQPNRPPVVVLNGPSTVNEGGTVPYTFTVTDPDPGQAFSLVAGSVSCGAGGSLAGSPVVTATGGSFNCKFPDGPASSTVSVQVQDAAGALSNTAALDVAVQNVAPVLGTGKVVANNDEWPLTNFGFSRAPSAAQFARNIADYFTGGAPGKFLVYSTNFGLADTQLAAVMTGAGHVWDRTTVNQPGFQLTLQTALQYDAIFLAADPVVNNQVLIDYVNAGGNVYVAGGTGCCGGAGGEAGRWNTFLNAFGLNFGAPYNGATGVFAPVSSHPLLNNVSSVYFDNGNVLTVTNPAIAQMLFSLPDGRGMLAVSAIGSVSANSIDEGQTSTLNVNFTDPGTLDTHVAQVDWGDGASSTINLPLGARSLSAQHLYANNRPGDAPYTITITVTDKDGGSDTDTTQITVRNVPPTVTLTGPASANEGTTQTYNYTVSDPGPDAQTLTVDCGTAGVLVAPAAGGSFECRFPDGPATSAVTAKSVDADGAASNLANITVTVANLPPAITLSGPATAAGSASYTFTLNDPGQDTFIAAPGFPDCGPGQVVAGSLAIGTASGSFDCSFNTGGPATIRMQVLDSDGAPSNISSVTTSLGSPPTVTANVAGTLGSNGWYTSDVAVSWTITPHGAPVTATTGCDPVTLTANTTGITYTCTADSLAGPGSDSVTIKRDASKPVITASATVGGSPYVAGTWVNQPVTVTFTCTEAGPSGIGTNTVAGSTVSSSTASVTNTGTCTDQAGNVADPASFGPIRIDQAGPALSCVATPGELWPANHKLVTIKVTVTATDGASGVAGYKLVSVTSNEPDNGLGDGDTPNDIQGWAIGTPDVEGQLRAERAGPDKDRVYTLTYEATDVAGNTSTCTAAVTVPHDKR